MFVFSKNSRTASGWPKSTFTMSINWAPLRRSGRRAAFLLRFQAATLPPPLRAFLALKTAEALGLEVPWFLHQRADEVIE